MLSALIIAHLCGDFFLQNEWMQAKSRSSLVCTAHVACYMLPFVALSVFVHLPMWLLAAIAVEHWLQDRFGLHLYWIKLKAGTPAEKWPLGPLANDQAMHLTWIGVVALAACLT